MNLTAISATPMSCSHKKTLKIGVLLLDIVQFLDVGPIDLIGIASADYLKSHGFPSDLVALGLDLSILYISPTHDDNSYDPSFAQCTAGAALKVTRSLKSPDCAPGTLDILLIPGPNPAIIITPEVKEFVQGHAAVKETTVLIVCVAAFVAAQAGILDGKTATGPRGLLPQLKEKYTHVKWITKRWAVDGNIWTSGKRFSFYARQHF
jgi:putative intracellular protease/amidase